MVYPGAGGGGSCLKEWLKSIEGDGNVADRGLGCGRRKTDCVVGFVG